MSSAASSPHTRAATGASRKASWRTASPSAAHPIRSSTGLGIFERCWPNNAPIKRSRFEKMIEADGEVFVTYVLEKTDGTRGRNTEFFVVDGDRITRCDVYFGPSLS